MAASSCFPSSSHQSSIMDDSPMHDQSPGPSGSHSGDPSASSAHPQSSDGPTAEKGLTVHEKRFAYIWVAAMDQFKQDTRKDLHVLVEDRLMRDMSSPGDVIKLLEDKKNNFKTYRKKGEKVRAVLMPFLELVERFSDTAGGVVGVVSIVGLWTFACHCSSP